MLQSITQRARHPSAATRETEREVVAAISSAEGSADLSRGGGRALGFALPLLALAAGAALGYSSTRWLGFRTSSEPTGVLREFTSSLRSAAMGEILSRESAWTSVWVGSSPSCCAKPERVPE